MPKMNITIKSFFEELTVLLTSFAIKHDEQLREEWQNCEKIDLTFFYLHDLDDKFTEHIRRFALKHVWPDILESLEGALGISVELLSMHTMNLFTCVDSDEDFFLPSQVRGQMQEHIMPNLLQGLAKRREEISSENECKTEAQVLADVVGKYLGNLLELTGSVFQQLTDFATIRLFENNPEFTITIPE